MANYQPTGHAKWHSVYRFMLEVILTKRDLDIEACSVTVADLSGRNTMLGGD